MAERVSATAATGDIGALRSAWAGVFGSTELYFERQLARVPGYRDATAPVAEATLGRLLLAPLLRQDAVLNYDDGYWEGDPAVVRRVPLAFESADLSTSSGVPE